MAEALQQVSALICGRKKKTSLSGIAVDQGCQLLFAVNIG